MSWFAWLGRSEEKKRAYDRLEALRQEYGAQGERVIKLSARTDLARKAQGSTQRAFDFVEQAFAAATGEYSRAGELLERIEADLVKGHVGGFPEAEGKLTLLGQKLDDLERHLENWEATWRQAPLVLAEAERSLAELTAQAERAGSLLGSPLPLGGRLAALQQHLERVRQTLAGGNPVEATHLVEDFRLAMTKVAELVGLYTSGAGAIDQAERDVARVRERLAAQAGAPSEAVASLGAAEALLPRLKPALAAGNLEQFQHDLLQLQRHLASVR